MSYPEGYPSRSDQDPLPAKFTLGGREYLIPAKNTLIRRFTKGEGGFDHLIHYEDEGFLVLLANDQVALDYFDELERRGFRVEALQEPDDATIRIITELEIASMTSPEDE